MKTILTVAVLFVVAAANLAAQEPAKTKVAIVRLDRIVNSGVNFEQLRLLQTDKESLEAIRKINEEIGLLQKEIINAENETKLSEVGRKIQFLNQKMNLLRQRFVNNQDFHAAVRDFVVENYKDKYSLILQMDQNNSNRVVWKNNAEVVDITDDVSDRLRERIKQALGEQGFGWAPAYPPPATFYPYPASVLLPTPVVSPGPSIEPYGAPATSRAYEPAPRIAPIPSASPTAPPVRPTSIMPSR